MDKAEAIQAIAKRSDAVRVPIYKLCGMADPPVAPSTFTRWKSAPDMAHWSTIGKLEAALDAIEQEKSR